MPRHKLTKTERAKYRDKIRKLKKEIIRLDEVKALLLSETGVRKTWYKRGYKEGQEALLKEGTIKETREIILENLETIPKCPFVIDNANQKWLLLDKENTE